MAVEFSQIFTFFSPKEAVKTTRAPGSHIDITNLYFIFCSVGMEYRTLYILYSQAP